MKLSIKILSLVAFALCFSACDEFLDVMPDNRTEIDSVKKVRALLTSAYTRADIVLMPEFLSDNVDDYGPENPYHDRFFDQIYYWEEVTELDFSDPETIWGELYLAIGAANQAIQSINDMGGVEKTGMTAEMAEALLCRAYNHFMLVNLFAHAYNGVTSGKDLGITYMEAPETSLNPKYERNTVKEVYEKIDADIQAALPWVSDAYYTVPKYHFNKNAAYAFAARFYLFYEKWDKAVEYADKVLGSKPATMLRDWKEAAKLVTDEDVVTRHFVEASLPTNLMLITHVSQFGATQNGYSYIAKYSHGGYLAENEDGIALAALFGMTNAAFYHCQMYEYKGTNFDKTNFWKLPYLFEMSDPVAQTGTPYTVNPAFTADQLILERAEAKILKKDYSSAVDDMNIWLHNISKVTDNVTVETINNVMKDIPYSTWDASTVKKKLNPKFEIEEGGLQENLLQFLILLKRVDGLHMGLRWYDVKRYGIEIERRVIGSDGLPAEFVDRLKVDDPRRAIQIPRKVVDAGYTPNPRATAPKTEMIAPAL